MWEEEKWPQAAMGMGSRPLLKQMQGMGLGHTRGGA